MVMNSTASSQVISPMWREVSTTIRARYQRPCCDPPLLLPVDIRGSTRRQIVLVMNEPKIAALGALGHDHGFCEDEGVPEVPVGLT